MLTCFFAISFRKDEMSETYLSTGTMAWPDEPETDYNVKVPLWEQLNIPVGPQYSEGLGMQLPAVLQRENEAKATAKALAAEATQLAQIQAAKKKKGRTEEKGGEEVDWSTFDFSSADSGADAEDFQSEDKEIDDFFKTFEKPAQTEDGLYFIIFINFINHYYSYSFFCIIILIIFFIFLVFFLNIEI